MDNIHDKIIFADNAEIDSVWDNAVINLEASIIFKFKPINRAKLTDIRDSIASLAISRFSYFKTLSILNEKQIHTLQALVTGFIKNQATRQF